MQQSRSFDENASDETCAILENDNRKRCGVMDKRTSHIFDDIFGGYP
jgi:hypothetical protein